MSSSSIFICAGARHRNLIKRCTRFFDAVQRRNGSNAPIGAAPLATSAGVDDFDIVSPRHSTNVVTEWILEVRKRPMVLALTFQMTGYLRCLELVGVLALSPGTHVDAAVVSGGILAEPLRMLSLLLLCWNNTSGTEGPSYRVHDWC